MRVELQSGSRFNFSPEARSSLEKQGYLIYPLTGISLRKQVEAGKPIRTDYWLNDKNFGSKNLPPLQVAFNPKQLFVPYSHDRNRYDQIVAMSKFNAKLGISGVMVAFLDADYISELVFSRLDKTGERLFGENVNNHLTRTKSGIGAFGELAIGDFSKERLNIIPCSATQPFISVGAALFIVPAK